MRFSSIICLLVGAAIVPLNGVVGERTKTKGRRATRGASDSDGSTSMNEGRSLQYSLAGHRGGAGGGTAKAKVGGGGKGGGPSDVCRTEAQTVILENEGDICGQTLNGGDKYVIQLERGTRYLDCGTMGGPTLVGDGTTLDCNGELIVGDIYMGMTGTGQRGIRMEDETIVENCRVRSFSGNGFIMSGDGEKKLLDSYVEDVNLGLLIRRNVDIGPVSIINFQSYNNQFQGIRINGDTDTTIVSPRISRAGLGPEEPDIGRSSGIRIQGNGDHLIIDPFIEMSENRAINIVGNGDTTVVGGTFTNNMNSGFAVQPASTGNHILKNIETSRNVNHGVAYEGMGSITIQNIEATDNGSAGVLADATGAVTLLGGELTENGSAGFFSSRDQTGDVVFENVDVSDNDGDGIKVRGNHDTTITGGTITDNELDGIDIDALDGYVVAVTITGVTIEKNKEAGIRQEGLTSGGSVTATVSSSVINENKDDGIRIGRNGLFNVDCTSVVKNTGRGIVVNRGELNIVDSDVSETKDSMGMEGTNLEITSRGGGPTITLDRVRVCEGDMVDVTDDQPVLNGVDLASTTCDSIITLGNPSSVECGFTCDDCEVEIPGWCLTPDSPYFDSTTCSASTGVPVVM